MRNSLKVARWEIKRNMKNKSFVISLFLTPAIFLIIMAFPMLMNMFEGEPDPVHVYIDDELGVWNEHYREMLDEEREWNITLNPENEQAVFDELKQPGTTMYIQLHESALQDGSIPIYMSEDADESLAYQFRALEDPLRLSQLENLGLSSDDAERIIHGIGFDIISIADLDGDGNGSEEPSSGGADAAITETDPLKRVIPGVFAGLILFSVIITGTMIFQSASQEKKDKLSETILSSITPTELMQGKILGYFVLGIVQVVIWFAIAIPIVMVRFNMPLIEYLLVPELLILLFYALAGYLMFAALFVGLGATVEDMSTSGNFQGVVFMIPWIPFMLFGPIIANPEGTVALIGSYIPLTTPGVMLLRLSLLEEWSWMEILISSAALLVSIWLFMKLAGKIFKVGILMYGKNATPKEIWKWLWH